MTQVPLYLFSSLMVHVFRSAGKRSTAKNYHPVSLLFVVSKVFEKLVNNTNVDHLEKYGLFSDFWYVLFFFKEKKTKELNRKPKKFSKT